MSSPAEMPSLEQGYYFTEGGGGEEKLNKKGKEKRGRDMQHSQRTLTRLHIFMQCGLLPVEVFSRAHARQHVSGIKSESRPLILLALQINFFVVRK